MRLKDYILVLLTVSFILFFPNGVNARVGVQCSSCHTMHNSQDGNAVVYELNDARDGYDNAIATPNNYLLNSDCAGCHSSATSDTIVDGTSSVDGGTPIVFNTLTITEPLAGGNFSNVLNDHSYGHNVDFIVGPDGQLSTVPPGGSNMSSQLTCAGEFGCHGDRSSGKTNYSGTKGSHHTDDTGGITGAKIGLSYRFLDGILGTEDADWEQNSANTSHNQYKGSTFSGPTNTISYFCSRCHGDFHESSIGEVGTGSPWLRHPTDVELPVTGEYSGYDPTVTYNNVVPVAYTTPANPTRATAVVMCLSCHRAHASQYYKILRWDTQSTLAKALSGCNVCHTSKD